MTAPIRKAPSSSQLQHSTELLVSRVFEDGHRETVGRMVDTGRHGCWWAFEPQYLADHPYGSPSPLRLPLTTVPVRTPEWADRRRRHANQGLHGFLADALPDGWGRMVTDAWLGMMGTYAPDLTPLDRLSIVAERGVGGLVFYDPDFARDREYFDLFDTQHWRVDLEALRRAATGIFDTHHRYQPVQADHAALLPLLVAVGQVNGSRPKALLYLRFESASPEVSLTPRPGFSPYLVKFASDHFPLGLEEPIWEAAALTVARAAGIRTQDWKLLNVGAAPLLALSRFDRTPFGGRVFVSAAGLLDVDFKEMPLDLKDLFGLTYALTKSATEMREVFRRAVFDVLIRNDDNHAKNVGFLLSDADRWSLAPAFDVMFSGIAPRALHQLFRRGRCAQRRTDPSGGGLGVALAE